MSSRSKRGRNNASPVYASNQVISSGISSGLHQGLYKIHETQAKMRPSTNFDDVQLNSHGKRKSKHHNELQPLDSSTLKHKNYKGHSTFSNGTTNPSFNTEKPDIQKIYEYSKGDYIDSSNVGRYKTP